MKGLFSAALAMAVTLGAASATAHTGTDGETLKRIAALDAVIDAAEERGDEDAAQRAELLVERAGLERMRGGYGSALADLNEAYELAPDLLQILLERGLTLAALAQAREARLDLEGFIAAAPQLDAYLALCRLEQHDDADDATHCYEEGVGVLEDAAILKLAFVSFETKRRHYDRALALLDTIIAHPAVKAEAALLRAEVLEARAEKDQQEVDDDDAPPDLEGERRALRDGRR